jgi:FtsH-binding integral membrane protein
MHPARQKLVLQILWNLTGAVLLFTLVFGGSFVGPLFKVRGGLAILLYFVLMIAGTVICGILKLKIRKLRTSYRSETL